MLKRRTDTGILGLVKRSNLRESSTLRAQVHRLKNENQQLKQENGEQKNLLAMLKDFNNWKQWKIGEG